jgi:arsenate reductase (thioredoxin)
VTPTPIRVLFLCTHNSARSQIAEAILRREGGREFEVQSAGTEATTINPSTIEVLSEIGIDWSGARSKVLTEFIEQPFDYVVTVCDEARAACPVFPGARRTLHWSIVDPAEIQGTGQEQLEAFRRTRANVSGRVRRFIEEVSREPLVGS